MTDFLTSPLPDNWHGRRIDPDFRHMVRLVNAYAHNELQEKTAALAFATELCRRFYRDPVPYNQLDEAYSRLIEFCIAGEKAAGDSASPDAPEPVTPFDYRCDAPYIVAAFQQAYGIDLTAERIHWFRFRALFAALPDETLMKKIISWRTADLSEYEGKAREKLAALQERFALPPELRGGAARVMSVEEHDRAFLARFRH